MKNNTIDIVFNLLEEFDGDSSLDYKAVQLFEKNNIPYTGETVSGLKLGKNKKSSKNIVSQAGVLVPKSYNLKNTKFPSIIKFNEEDGSFAIFKKNIVKNKKQLLDRYEYLSRKYDGELLIEEFIPGKEVYVSLLRDKKGVVEVFRPRELFFKEIINSEKEIYSERLKWSENKVAITKFLSDDILSERVKKEAKKVYEAFNLQSAARIDFRVDKNDIYFLEVNPNPNLAIDDDFCLSMMSRGYSYKECLEEILILGMRRKATSKAA